MGCVCKVLAKEHPGLSLAFALMSQHCFMAFDFWGTEANNNKIRKHLETLKIKPHLR